MLLSSPATIRMTDSVCVSLSICLRFVSGTIDRARMGTFERVLWRVLRGNLYMNYAE